MPGMSIMLDLDDPPTEDELMAVLSKKEGRAGDKSGILPEMVLYGSAVLWDRLLELHDAGYVDEWRSCG